MNTKTEALVSTSPDTAISVSGSAKKTPVEPAGTTFTFKEPLGSASAIYWLVLAILAGYGLTFGLQDLAKVFHSPFLQKIADFFFYGGMMTKAVWQGQIWRPVTVAFLHGGMFHLFGNVANLLFLAWFAALPSPAKAGWQSSSLRRYWGPWSRLWSNPMQTPWERQSASWASLAP
jgi:hypothetical protein